MRPEPAPESVLRPEHEAALRAPPTETDQAPPLPPPPSAEPPPSLEPPTAAPPLAPAPQASRRRRRAAQWLRRGVLVVGGLVAAWALVVGVLAPPLVRFVAATELSAALERPVAIDRVVINPFSLVVTVRGFMLRDRDGNRFVGFDELRVNLQAMSLYRRGLIVRDVTLVRPTIRLVRDRAHHYNFSDLVEPAAKAPPAAGAGPRGATRYSVNNIRVLDGSVDFVDRPMRRTHTIRGLVVALPFVSNLPYDADEYVVPELSARVDGSALGLGARARPFLPSRETVVDLELRDVPLGRYLDYSPLPLGLTLPSARLDVALSLALQKRPDEAPRARLSGELALRDVVADDRAGRPLLRWSRLDVAIAPSEPLAGTLRLARVQLDRPTLWVRRDAAGHVSLADVMPARDAPASPPSPTPFLVEAESARIAGGTVHFSDAPRGGPFAATLRDLAFEARHFSTARGAATAVTLHLASNAGETLDQRGTLTVSPLAAAGHVALTGVPLPRYAPYYAPLVLVDVDRGTLDVAADYELGGSGAAMRVHDGALTLRALATHRRGERRPLVAVRTLAAQGVGADVGARTLEVGDVAVRDGRLRLARAADGTWNLSGLVATAPTRAAAPAAPASAPPWSVAVAHAAVDRWTVRLEDARPDPDDPVQLAVTLQSATVSGYSSLPGSRARFALRARIGGAGALTASGNLAPAPLGGTLRLDGKSIDLVPLAPYFADRVNFVLTRGAASFGGKLALATTARGLSARYQGHVLVDELVTVDADEANPLLTWDSLYVAGIDAASAPPSLAVDEVSLSGFHARLAVGEDGRLNVRGLVPEAPGAPKPAGPRLPVRVAKVTLQAGTIDWSDDFVRPRFATSLVEIGGRISALSSSPDTVADVDLRGKLEGIAPLEITGAVNPLADELALKLAVMFRDIELSPLSPYSGKYAGYEIARGKLTLALDYDVHARKLAATNKVFIDQLQLGERVRSPQATKLPVKLIVFVLRDRKGEIHLDLPIQGSLDDPRFRLGPIIWQALLNLLVKAATQPFAMLGAMFGRGPELAWLEFAPGSAALDATAADKLRVVAKMLDSRPGLKLEITGHVGVDADRQGLLRLAFERKVKSQKHKALTKKHVAVAESVDQLTVAADEYERYLTLAYGEEKFPKPRNALGLVKKLPPAEMEKLMLTHIVVDDEELRLLATRRAEAARAALVKAGIATDRVFVLEPKTLAAPPHDQARATRVDFTIR